MDTRFTLGKYVTIIKSTDGFQSEVRKRVPSSFQPAISRRLVSGRQSKDDKTPHLDSPGENLFSVNTEGTNRANKQKLH